MIKHFHSLSNPDELNSFYPCLFVNWQMQVQQKQFTGLVADLMPNIRLMRFVGHFLNKYSNGSAFLNQLYSWANLILMLLQFICIVVNLAYNTSEVNELTANTVTTLHFLHTLTKFSYLAINNKNFYRTFNIWNQSNSHPLFAESDARYHSIALAKMRKNLYTITGLTLATVTCKFNVPIMIKMSVFIGNGSFLAFNPSINFLHSYKYSMERYHILRWKC